MLLNVIDRLLFPSILPQEGNRIEMVLKKDILSKVEFSQDEMTKIDLRFENNSYHWNKSLEVDLSVEFTEKELEFIRKGITAIDSSNKVTIEMLPTLEKFDK